MALSVLCRKKEMEEKYKGSERCAPECGEHGRRVAGMQELCQRGRYDDEMRPIQQVDGRQMSAKNKRRMRVNQLVTTIQPRRAGDAVCVSKLKHLVRADGPV
jgi:hypothetical protein